MSLHYFVSPVRSDERFARWLHDFGIMLPAHMQSRFPTLREICAVLEHLEGYSCDMGTDYSMGGTHWEVDIVKRGRADTQWISEWANLCVMNYQGNDDTPLAFYFRKGFARLTLLIVQRLAQICGPLIIAPDSGFVPLLVTPDTDVDQVLRAWDD
ncbi:MAG TPA: hypothetical protein VKR06_31735 [Ktedonosporobacter sp.]|nr:hypothetical protein [Ktedonosporobacter sp.]